jgi:hypothetical protein
MVPLVEFDGVLLCVVAFRMQKKSTVSEVSSSDSVHNIFASMIVLSTTQRQ